ncbi:MAG: HD-GYP domain-containing protein [Clostridiaceae bacterium]
MRYVPIKYIKSGMVLAKTIYGQSGELLLRAGTPIQMSYVNRMEVLGYSGIYIEDKLSEGISVDGVISEELKMNTVKTVRNFMRTSTDSKNIQKPLLEIEDLVEDIVDQISENKKLMVNMVDLKVASNYTYYHSVNVSVLSLVIGVALNLDKKTLCLLGISALMHDYGKIEIPLTILDKPGKLTEEEYEKIKIHPLKGYEYAKRKLFLHTVAYMGIYQHHERYNGTGYPEKLKGDKISLFGRIIAIADVYDALTSDRPYRKGIFQSEAIEYIMANGGILFDPELVRVFSSKIAPYPIGTCVKLSNGNTGVIAKNYTNFCLRPLVRVVKEKDTYIEPYYIDLLNSNLNVTVVAVENELKDYADNN